MNGSKGCSKRDSSKYSLVWHWLTKSKTLHHLISVKTCTQCLSYFQISPCSSPSLIIEYLEMSICKLISVCVSINHCFFCDFMLYFVMSFFAWDNNVFWSWKLQQWSTLVDVLGLGGTEQSRHRKITSIIAAKDMFSWPEARVQGLEVGD